MQFLSIELKRAASTSIWIIVGSFIALFVLGLVARFTGMSITFLVIIVPPLVAQILGDRLRKQKVYLPLSERLLITILSVGGLGAIIISLVSLVRIEPIEFSFMTMFLLILETVLIFTVLTLMTIMNKE